MSTGSPHIYIFFGPPGSGKGTLASRCVNMLGWAQLSAGNLCRQEIANKTEIGSQIDFTIKSGKLIPDGLITRILEGAFKRYVNNYSSLILDGYPRTVAQAQELDKILIRDNGDKMSLSLVKLLVADDTVIKRISSRLICPNEKCQATYSLSAPSLAPRRSMECDVCSSTLVRRSDDDTEEIVRNRLAHYYSHEKNILDYYRRHNNHFIEISVEKPMDEVFQEFKYSVGIESNDNNKR